MWKSSGRAASLRVLPWHLPYKCKGKTRKDGAQPEANSQFFTILQTHLKIAAAGFKTRTQITLFRPRQADQHQKFTPFTVFSPASQATKTLTLKYTKPIFVRVG